MELKRQMPVGDMDQNFDRPLGHLFDNRADGALSGVSTILHEHEGSLFISRNQLLSFSTSVDDLPETLWPEEIANAAPG